MRSHGTKVMLTHFEDFDRLGVPCLLDTETNEIWVPQTVIYDLFNWDRDLTSKLRSKSINKFFNHTGVVVKCVTVKHLDSRGRPNTLKLLSAETFDVIAAWAYSCKKLTHLHPYLTPKAKQYAADYPHFVSETRRLKGLKVGLKRTEFHVRDRLANRLGGLVELNCPVGRIDVLTTTEVIEVKEVKDWKSALGQVLAYKYFYPEHTARIHLYKSADKELKTLITAIAKCQDVRVTWEP